MSAVSFDPAKKLDLYFRVNRDGSKTLSFVDADAADYDISGLTFALTIYDRPASSSVLSLTEGSGLSKPDNYSLTITVTDVQTINIRPNKYFYTLNRTDGSGLVKTWLTGSCYFHEGEFDGVTETTSLTIDETSGALTVTINDTVSPIAASQSEVNTGTATSGFVNPATLANKDASAVALTDGASIALTKEKHTLTTSEAAITFTNTFTGDGIVMEVTLNATSSTFTFPVGYLCMANGTASGDNTLSLSGTSGDKYVIVILKFGSQYYVSSNNLGQ